MSERPSNEVPLIPGCKHETTIGNGDTRPTENPLTRTENGIFTDSTPFADCGVPAVYFARYCPSNTATIHNSYDTSALIKPENLLADIAFVAAFADRMANAVCCPVARKIPDNMKEKLDIYLCRQREQK